MEFIRRNGHEIAIVRSQLYLFGGERPNGSLIPRHIVRQFDFESKKWKEIKTRPFPGSTLPSACRDARTAVSGDLVYSYGGIGERQGDDRLAGALASLFAFNTLQCTWRRLATEPNQMRPSRRSSCGIAAIGGGVALAIFGGYGPQPTNLQPDAEWIGSSDFENSDGWNNELFLFDIHAECWEVLDSVGTRPPPCAGHTFTPVNEYCVVMFGGQNSTERSNALYTLTLRKAEKWHGDWKFIIPAQESIQGELPWPSKRSSHAALCIPSSAGPVVLIVGGLGICQVPCPDDAYFWDVTTSRWDRIHEHGLPLRLWNHALGIYISPESDQVSIVCFGGLSHDFDGDLTNGDFITWRWDDSSILYLSLEVQRLRCLTAAYQKRSNENRAAVAPTEKRTHGDITRFQEAIDETEQRLSSQLSAFRIRNDEVKEIGKELGRGSYGAVNVAQWQGVKVAVKCFYRLLYAPHVKQLWEQELLLCARLRHPNVVSYFGATVIDGTPLQIIMELLEGSLGELIAAATTNSGEYALRDIEMIDVAYDCAAGVAYLHGLQPSPCIHCDIRPTNVLVSHNMTAKLGDFGASHLLESSLSVGPVSANYAAPERFVDHSSDIAIAVRSSIQTDVYSLGVTMCEVFTGQAAVRAARRRQVAMVQDQRLAALCTHMVSLDSNARPSAPCVLSELEEISRSAEHGRVNKRLVCRCGGEPEEGRMLMLVERFVHSDA